MVNTWSLRCACMCVRGPSKFGWIWGGADMPALLWEDWQRGFQLSWSEIGCLLWPWCPCPSFLGSRASFCYHLSRARWNPSFDTTIDRQLIGVLRNGYTDNSFFLLLSLNLESLDRPISWTSENVDENFFPHHWSASKKLTRLIATFEYLLHHLAPKEKKNPFFDHMS